MTRTADHATRLSVLRDEAGRLADLEGRSQAALDSLVTAIPAAQEQVDLARVSTEVGVLAAAQDQHRKLELERSNAESVIRGVATRRPLLEQDLRQAEAAIARAKAKELCPVVAAGELTREALVDGFSELAELVANGITPAIQAGTRDDNRGLTEAADLPQLARWIWVLAAQAGVDLDQARHRAGSGIDPATTVANLRAVIETLS